MRKLKLIALNLLLALIFAVSVFAAEFDKTVSIAGGSAQRLSTVLVANGWTGSYTCKQLMITNYDSAPLTLYIGQSTVATDGYQLPPGTSIEYFDADSTQKFLYVASTQSVGIVCHSQ